MTGLERAIWWSEYVIRHKGAKRLKSPTLDLPWHQFLLLDVIGALILIILIIFSLIYKLYRFSLTFCCGKSKKSIANKNKAKKVQ